MEKAVLNPLLDVDITGAKSALINVTGDENMSIREARSVMIAIAEKLDPEAKIIWGARIEEELKGSIRVLLIATGLQTFNGTKRLEHSQNLKTEHKSNNNHKLFDIKEKKKIQFEPTVTEKKESNVNVKEKKNTKKVFTEIFEEEIKGDLNVLKNAVEDIDSQSVNEKILQKILKACISLQSSAQLFSYDKIEEFTIFIADVTEGLISGDIKFSDDITSLLVKFPSIIEGMVNNNQTALPQAQELIENLTKFIDNSNRENSPKNSNQYLEDKVVIGDESLTDNKLKSKFQMEVN